MPPHLFLKSKARRRFWLFLFLLQIPVISLCAADKRLTPGHVPTAVVRAHLAPLGRLPGTNQMRLALALPVRNADALTNLLAAIYNPASPEYHHYLTPKEFAARFGPTPADYAAVIRFAETNGLTVTATHPNRLLVDVTGKVSDVERAFHVRLNSYRHPQENRNFFAPDVEPTVDARLPVFQLSGLDDFSLPHPHGQWRPLPQPAGISPHGGSSPGGSFMGDDFRRAYVPGTALTGGGQSVGLLQFDGFHAEDITNYANTIGLSNNLPELVIVPVNGGVPWTGSGIGEVSLDIEMVLSMSPGVSNIYVYEAPNPSPWADILSQMANDNLAQQLSCSWGGGGPDPASEQIFLQMAAQGQSFFNATGDFDAFTGVIEFPSDSPNIIQVGGTTLTTDTNGNYLSETVWNRGYDSFSGNWYGSGGGISTSVAIPAWQEGTDMTTNHGSLVLRNVPDVALTAENVYIFSAAQPGVEAGTSCAAPLWAGLTALINQQAAQLGQPPVGFLNPAIYALGRGTNYAATFHDITTGNNTNASSQGEFFAVPGYDLCTGWGTPAGTNLINALTTPDDLGINPHAVFSTSGLVGGPFSQTNWTIGLTNSGAGSLAWALGDVPAWLAVSADNGTLVANGATNLNLQLINPQMLPPGSYRAGLLVSNLALARVQTVAVQLDIGQSIVQNGGFETGDFAGWTLLGDTFTGQVAYNVVATESDFPGVVHSGKFGAYLHEGGYLAKLSQTLVATPGQRYLVSFWLDNLQAGGGQEFRASWAGTNFVNLVNPPAFTWSNLQFTACANETNVLLQFGAENDAHYFCLDDVSVTAVPSVTFASAWADTSGIQLAWNSLAGLSYLVQYKTNLAQADWLEFGTVAATTNLTQLVDTNFGGGDAQRFYRLVLLP